MCVTYTNECPLSILDSHFSTLVIPAKEGTLLSYFLVKGAFNNQVSRQEEVGGWSVNAYYHVLDNPLPDPNSDPYQHLK